MLAPAAGAGDALLIARQAVAVAEEKTPVHPYLARQMSDFRFRQTLEVRTLGCRAMGNQLAMTLSSPPTYRTASSYASKKASGSVTPL